MDAPAPAAALTIPAIDWRRMLILAKRNAWLHAEITRAWKEHQLLLAVLSPPAAPPRKDPTPETLTLPAHLVPTVDTPAAEVGTARRKRGARA